MKIINIHVPVSNQSFTYYDYLVGNYTSLAEHPTRLRFIAQCLDKGGSGSGINNKLTHTYVQLPLSRGSDGHANAVNSALTFTNEDDITLIVDADTVMLAKNWDSTLETMLKTHGIVGTTYEDIGGFSSGPGPVQTYKGKPNATWMALSPEYDWSTLQVNAAKSSNIQVLTDEQSRLWNLPVGFELLRDVGWQIPEYIKTIGSEFVAFKHVKPTKGAKAIRTEHDYHEEYWLPDGSPFVGHQRGSMKHAFRNSSISTPFYNACEVYINSL